MVDHGVFAQPELVSPGPQLAGYLGAWQADMLPPGATDAVSAMIAWQRMVNWAESGLNDAILAVMAGSTAAGDGEDWGREEVSAALRLSNSGAANRVQLARTLVGPLAATGHELRAGRVSLRYADALADSVKTLRDPEQIQLVEKRVLAKAASHTVAQMKRYARRQVLKVDPEGADQRHEKARAQRRVEFYPVADSMAELRAFLPADGAAQLRATLDGMAGRIRAKGDSRTIDQRRADALLALGTQPTGFGATAEPVPQPGGPSGSQPAQAPDKAQAPRLAALPRIGLIAPLATVTGSANLPGELTGFGPVAPTVVRHLATADRARWEKWVSDPGGVVTNVGRSSYRPPAGLAALVRAGSPTCVFPGCSQPSYRCDLDHVVRWADGGDTSKENLVPLCRLCRIRHKAHCAEVVIMPKLLVGWV